MEDNMDNKLDEKMHDTIKDNIGDKVVVKIFFLNLVPNEGLSQNQIIGQNRV